MNCEKVNPYDDRRDKSKQVREMFDSIAPAYDFMNRAMTLGIDRIWRRKTVDKLRELPHDYILDIATGTGDLAILMAQRLDPISITGVDLSEEMLEKGRKKVIDENLDDTIKLCQGDCLNLPFPDNMFDVVTSAFGVRNFENLLAGYKEMHRVLKTGGTVSIIELSTPESAIVKPFYRAYTRGVIPAIGRLVSSDRRAYSYLPESIEAVPQGEEMLELMRQAGFSNCAYRTFTLGVCSVYTATK
ncbi:MAG: bifunctional demethylmenaquinone methyltransferase/2-methoxy-6-polyprenyl-1,4-benzoquinol methylase UbiE [Lachnoclostridium sp.]|nr:bifunctional demethylmenaquinone methyltransferase/2-methoxy-6-polyprenyl-1,4-benzoquinol methylase UbiE [Lachnoclostridium sp.]